MTQTSEIRRKGEKERPASTPRRPVLTRLWVLALPILSLSPALSAQPDGAPQPPADVWKGAIGAGLSLTRGNSDTANYTISFEAVRDPGTRHILRLTGLYLRSDQKGLKTADRLRLGFRDEMTRTDRAFLYFDLGYVRDAFKEIDYLINPQAGVGWKIVKTDRVILGFDGGAGVVWENNTFASETRRSGSVNAGQQFELRLSEGSRIVQHFAGLWKMENFEDALYHFSVALASRLTQRIELKVEFVDDYKNIPPTPEIRKNDTAFLTSVLFNF